MVPESQLRPLSHPSHWAHATPDTPAVIMAESGETVSFGEMELAANRGANLLRRLGLKPGDTFALWSGNNPRFLEIAWAMNRAGAYMVPIAAKLTAHEAAYIIDDCDAKIVIIDANLKHAAQLTERFAELCPRIQHAFTLRGDMPGFQRWEDAISGMPDILELPPVWGQQMLYSSGTTGQPKGIRRPMRDVPYDSPLAFAQLMSERYGSQAGMKFVLSAPLYHSGPLAMALSVQSIGLTLLLCERFDAEAMLAMIDRYQPEQGQFVPTMFVRLLKLPSEVRSKYNVSSLKIAIHSAAPCSVETKRAMIDWWGPVLEDIYGGSENVGSTMISSTEWLTKPGSVGRPVKGELHICDDSGREVAPREHGTIYFEAPHTFEYHKDPEKTHGIRHPDRNDWATLGDVGWIDEDGYLYLSDRKAFMVVSGGVNIYPQEAEDILTSHPDVADVAAFGIPDEDMGERLIAVVQPVDWATSGPVLAAQLEEWCKQHLATLKCPKFIEFVETLERDPAGKIAKKVLKDRFTAANLDGRHPSDIEAHERGRDGR